MKANFNEKQKLSSLKFQTAFKIWALAVAMTASEFPFPPGIISARIDLW